MDDSGAYTGARAVSSSGTIGPSDNPQTRDISDLKSILTLSGTEIRLRQAMVLVGSLAIAAVSARWEVAGFGVGIFGLSLLLGQQLGQSPLQVTKRRYAWVVTLIVALSCAYVLFSLYLWSMHQAAFQIVSIAMMAASMFSSISVRARSAVLLRVDVIAISATVLLRIVLLPATGMAGAEAAIVAVSLILLLVYYCVTLVKFRKTVEALDEERRTRDRLARTQAVGRLTGGVAHDFNNMLTAVLGNLELARLTQSDDERSSLIAEAADSARKGALLTRQLLALSGRSRVEPEDCSVADVLQDAIAMLSGDKAVTGDVELWCEPNLPPVHVDRMLTALAVSKLLDNALDALPADTRPVMQGLRNTDMGIDTVVVQIRDHGPGISKDLMPFVFEPYFTTKPVGKGSGLGLPTARGIIEQMGGRIEIRSPVDKGAGTEVRVFLPIAGQGAG